MENFWTSKKHINGLRHFVLVNESKEKIFCMVSVLDASINLEINYDELVNSGNWFKGWINLPKNESINAEYVNYKSNKSTKELDFIDPIYLNDDSLFNIS